MLISVMKRLPLCRTITTPSSFYAIRSRRFCASEATATARKKLFIPLHKLHYFRIEGRDTYKFLQGIITNDIYLLKEKNDCLACAILNPKGRVVSDLFMYNTTAEEDENQVG
jgi:folate-binding Fe-S cluster repair protein YgfZ